MRSRSGRLLESVIKSGELSADDLARELSASRKDIDSFVAGESVMDLPRQLCLALLAIERLPRFARTGRTLLGQVTAALAVEARRTALHAEPPARFTARIRS